MVKAGVHGRRLVMIFLVAVASGLALASVGLRELRATSSRYEELLNQQVTNALHVERLNTLSEKKGRMSRTYLLTGNREFLEELATTRRAFSSTLQELHASLTARGADQIFLRLERVAAVHERSVDHAVSLREQGAITPELVSTVESQVATARADLDETIAALSALEDRIFDAASAAVVRDADYGVKLLVGTMLAGLLLAGVMAWVLARTLAGLARSRAEVAASLARLQAANGDLDAFAGRIAHDLRNVLAPAGLAAATLRRASNPTAVARCADRIENATRRADGLIEGLLAFARAGQPPSQAGGAAVRPIVDEVLESFAHTRALVGAEVTVEAEEVTVRCAPNLLYTVLANLISNALKFVDGRPKREVRVSVRGVGPLVEIAVEDTGPGIPAEAQKRIFEPFYRAPDARVPGTGIGLATVQRIVLAYEGRVSVESRIDEGTRFLVRLPRADRASQEPPAPEPVVPAVH